MRHCLSSPLYYTDVQLMKFRIKSLEEIPLYQTHNEYSLQLKRASCLKTVTI
jgi:hypothetical protein